MAPDPLPDALVHRHVRAGFVGLAVFVLLGLGLEALHAYKSEFYLAPEGETRRLLLRLGHAHGTLLAIVNLLYGLVVSRFPRAVSRFASTAVLSALVLVPVGFVSGVVGCHDADPGPLVLLAPTGGVLLFLGLVDSARRVAPTPPP